MALYTGLIEKIEPTDDELAQVLAHEIAHALANHTAEKMSVAIASSLGIMAIGVATDNRNVTTGAAAAALVAITLPNSRTAESEADRIGIEMAAKAGYDPRAAVSLWQKMAKESGGSSFDFLSTHPSSGKRSERLQQLIPQMMPYYQEQKPHPVYPL
jgi:predicted Zn-dependent protease